MPARLLIIGPTDRRTTLAEALTREKFDTAEADGAEALHRFAAEHFDAVLLDVEALALIGALRARNLLPILVVAARPSEAGLVEAFDRGADDYVAFPVNAAKLAARLRAALRHRFQPPEIEPLLHYGEIAIDPANRRVLRAGRDIRLSPTEYEILTLLTQHAGKILTHDFLLRRVWGPNNINDTQYLRVYMRSLRQKLMAPEAQHRIIQTEAGIGYRFVPIERSTHSCQPAA